MFDICSICNEELDLSGNNIYQLPECNHFFHTNCIITWFKTGKNSCPLCNNNGINKNNIASLNNNILSSALSGYTWDYKKKLLEYDYKIMRRYSRKKEAPKELKKQVKMLIKLENKFKQIKKEEREFLNSIPTNLTVKQLKKKVFNLDEKII